MGNKLRTAIAVLMAFSPALLIFSIYKTSWVIPSMAFMSFATIGLFAIAQKMNNYSYESVPFKEESERETNTVKDDITFESVAGVEEIKEEIEEVADFLKNPNKYKVFGAKIPKGILFYGPPGTGKTLIARALANETESNFIYASGSEFIEKFVGVGASRVRSIFERAQKRCPCIVFIDEIDAIGVSRNTDNNSERDQTLNQLLIELDGFNQNEGVVVIAATNRLDMLDDALLRPGRFDRQIYVGNPCLNAREKILQVHLVGKPVAKNVDVRKIASKTGGMSGAHLANIINEAALIAIKKKKKTIAQEDFDEAIVKTSAGLKNSNMLLSEKEKQSISYHESGHAIAECFFNGKMPDRLTIVPHGAALGFMMVDGGEDKMLLAQEDLEKRICVLLAGRASEELVFSELTTGAQNDLQKANQLANQMVCDFGMSRYKNRVFNRQMDAFMSKEINEEITAILDSCYNKTLEMLSINFEMLEKLARELREKELIKRPEIEKVLEGFSITAAAE
ncbi:MAG: AAA family ATPase [Eubacteriaceae bacterium]|nr:AAA family ATPase [Eubacteriaceae bacterium]